MNDLPTSLLEAVPTFVEEKRRLRFEGAHLGYRVAMDRYASIDRYTPEETEREELAGELRSSFAFVVSTIALLLFASLVAMALS